MIHGPWKTETGKICAKVEPDRNTTYSSHDAPRTLQLMRQDGISVHTSVVLPKMISKHLVLLSKTLAPSRCLFPEAWSPKALRRLELGVRLTGQTGWRPQYYLIVRYAMLCTSALCLLKLFSTQTLGSCLSSFVNTTTQSLDPPSNLALRDGQNW